MRVDGKRGECEGERGAAVTLITLNRKGRVGTREGYLWLPLSLNDDIRFMGRRRTQPEILRRYMSNSSVQNRRGRISVDEQDDQK